MTPTEPPLSEWSLGAWIAHQEALREADLRFNEERDRRYYEVDTEREKALKIKETADLAALGLARDIQAYKDEKANELRAQIEGERGTYLTRVEFEAQFKPVSDFYQQTAGAQGNMNTRRASANLTTNIITAGIIAGGAIVTALIAVH